MEGGGLLPKSPLVIGQSHFPTPLHSSVSEGPRVGSLETVQCG